MKKLLMSLTFSLMACTSIHAQFTSTYKDPYGGITGRSETSSNYGGGTTTTYKDQYGNITGKKETNW